MEQGLVNAITSINQDFKERATAENAQKMGYPYIEIAKQPINPDLFTYVSVDTARNAYFLPFRQIGNAVEVAVVDPKSPQVQELQTVLTQQNLKLELYMATPEGILIATQPFLYTTGPKPELQQTQTTSSTQDLTREQYLHDLKELGSKLRELGESMEGLEQIEKTALKVGASDIHFQPEAADVLVRFRMDGVLQEVTRLEPNIYEFFSTQIKHKSGLKINLKTVPQDGRYTLNLYKTVDVRVSTIPTSYGESLVLRLLESDIKLLSLSDLGYTDQALNILKDATHLTQGMIVVTGPTGSGKSTTLYTLLQELNTPDRKIITLEDPVEYKISGIVQSPISNREGYTFAKGLQSILRQDPDVIMVGEIRDQATAETAAQAALTGHVVLCTLHTNSASQTIPRLLNMGVKPFIAAPALRAVVAQRLVRKLCSNCKAVHSPEPAELQYIEQVLKPYGDQPTSIQLYKAVGCDQCYGTGYKGRIVIAEGFNIDDTLAKLISENESESQIREYLLSKQMHVMAYDGVKKALSGLTTIEEVQRQLGW